MNFKPTKLKVWLSILLLIILVVFSIFSSYQSGRAVCKIKCSPLYGEGLPECPPCAYPQKFALDSSFILYSILIAAVFYVVYSALQKRDSQ